MQEKLDKDIVELIAKENNKEFKNVEVLSSMNVATFNDYQEALVAKDIDKLKELYQTSHIIKKINQGDFDKLTLKEKFNQFDFKAMLGYSSNTDEDIDNILTFNASINIKKDRIFKVGKYYQTQLYYSSEANRCFTMEQALKKITGINSNTMLCSFLKKLTGLNWITQYFNDYTNTITELQQQYSELKKPSIYKEDTEFNKLSIDFKKFMNEHNLNTVFEAFILHAMTYSHSQSFTKDESIISVFATSKQILEVINNTFTETYLNTESQIVTKLNYLCLIGLIKRIPDADIRKETLMSLQSNSTKRHASLYEISGDIYMNVKKHLELINNSNKPLSSLLKSWGGMNIQVSQNHKARINAFCNAYLIFKALEDNQIMTAQQLAPLVMRNNENYRNGKNRNTSDARIKNTTKVIISIESLLRGIKTAKIDNKFNREWLLAEGVKLNIRRTSKVYYFSSSEFSSFKMGKRFTLEILKQEGLTLIAMLDEIYENWKIGKEDRLVKVEKNAETNKFEARDETGATFDLDEIDDISDELSEGMLADIDSIFDEMEV